MWNKQNITKKIVDFNVTMWIITLNINTPIAVKRKIVG